MSDDPVQARIAAAERVLRAAGIRNAGVAALGHTRDVAAVRVAPVSFDAVAALAPALKSLGFRYVTLDLAPDTLG